MLVSTAWLQRRSHRACKASLGQVIIDFVVAIQRDDIPVLLKAFPAPQSYLTETAIIKAIETSGMFNLLDATQGDKADFWLLSDHPFDISRFSRKYVETVFGIPLKVSAAEDTILQKLRWAQETGGSARPFLDALRVYEVQYATLDLRYIEHWVQRLQLDNLWSRILMEALPLDEGP